MDNEPDWYADARAHGMDPEDPLVAAVFSAGTVDPEDTSWQDDTPDSCADQCGSDEDDWSDDHPDDFIDL